MFRLWISLLAAAVLAMGVPAAAQAGTAQKASQATSATAGEAQKPAKPPVDSTATIAAISPAHAKARVVVADVALLLIAIVLTYQLMGVLGALKGEVKEGGAPAVESHWGGFGGGMGGWRVSPALSYVFAALLLAALVGSIAAILDRRVRVVPSSGTPQRTSAAAPAPSTTGAATVDSIRRDSVRRGSIRRDSLRTDSAANQGTTTQSGGTPANSARESAPAT
jgi:hypothetical protein